MVLMILFQTQCNVLSIYIQVGSLYDCNLSKLSCPFQIKIVFFCAGKNCIIFSFGLFSIKHTTILFFLSDSIFNAN